MRIPKTDLEKKLTMTNTELSTRFCFILIGLWILIGLVAFSPDYETTDDVTTILETTTEIITETTTEIESEKETEIETTTEMATTRNYLVCEWGNFEVTEEEFELLCTTVFCEAGNQDMNTQYMVALTILNRVVDKDFPTTISEVIYQRDKVGTPQYSVIDWRDFENRGWTKQVEEAVRVALLENHHPQDMFYFRTKHYHKFGTPYKSSDDLYFSTEQ